MPAPAAIIYLVARFRANLDSYKRGLYNETQVRREFIDPPYDEQLPIRTIDFTAPADGARHDRMVALVERMLDQHKKLASERAPHVRTVLQRHAEGGGDGQADRCAGVRAVRVDRRRNRHRGGIGR
jgi:hypothetical protein